MSSVAFLFALIAMVIIVRWAIANDRAADSGRTTGLLAIKEPNAAPETAPAASGRQRRDRPERRPRRVTADQAPSGPAAAQSTGRIDDGATAWTADWTLGDAVGAEFSIAQVKPQGPNGATATEDDATEVKGAPSAPRRRPPARTRRSR